MKRCKTFLQIIVLSGICVAGGAVVHGANKFNPAQEQAGKEWLAAMNKDNDVTVDKKEFLDYMGKEFDLADADHDGTLDVHELGAMLAKLSIHR